MLSPGHDLLAARKRNAGANSLASGHALDAPQLKFAAGNNLDSGHSWGELHIQPARVNPLAVGQFTGDSEVQRCPAYGNTLTPGHTANANRNPRAGATFQRVILDAIPTHLPPAELTPPEPVTNSNAPAAGTMDSINSEMQDNWSKAYELDTKAHRGLRDLKVMATEGQKTADEKQAEAEQLQADL